MIFHHDPLHTDDFLDAFHGQAIECWEELGGRPGQVEFASERRELTLESALSPSGES